MAPQDSSRKNDGEEISSMFSSKKSKTFTNKYISIMLDETNFLLWKHQILLTMRSHKLEKHLNGSLKRLLQQSCLQIVN
ncbi:hypothetical protein GQ457_01G013700 [Hibiscus cannabinus]